MQRGMFIVLDGNDGSGKATQAKLLVEAFAAQGIVAEKVDFPAYEKNFFGSFIGECLAGKHGDFVNLDPKIASTLYSCDRHESSPHIRRLLEEGTIVIADRFSSSNQIHQGGKIADEKEREAFLLWLDQMEHGVLNVPRPDAIIYLKVPLEISLQLLSEKRALKMQEGMRDMVEEDTEYLKRSVATAQWLAEKESSWKTIDCAPGGTMRTREDIHEEVLGLVSGILGTPNN